MNNPIFKIQIMFFFVFGMLSWNGIEYYVTIQKHVAQAELIATLPMQSLSGINITGI